jgi:hypothetical protein
MRRQFAERGKILERIFNVASVELILVHRNPIDHRGLTGYVGRITYPAIRGRYEVPGALSVDRFAGIVKGVIARVIIILLDSLGLVFEEDTADPLQKSARL